MVYLLETEISSKKAVHVSLREIYGIGKPMSMLICKKAGFSKNLKTFNLSDKQILKLLQIVENSNVLVNAELKKHKELFFKHLIDVKSYRGLRRLRGLPVRGQRTHTNSKTVKRQKYK